MDFMVIRSSFRRGIEREVHEALYPEHLRDEDWHRDFIGLIVEYL